jgi:hypothetical protein
VSNRFVSLVAAAAAVALSFVPVPAAGQAPQSTLALGEGGVQNKPAPAGPTPRAADGKPDLSGVWGPERHFIYNITAALKPGDVLPMQSWAAELTKKRVSKDDPEANCLPTGVPRVAPYPWKILQTPTVIAFLFEGNIHSYRQIFLDGKPHPKDLDPTWYGDSRGHWEGDTLVVDTIGFNDKFWFDFAGHPHTERLHIVERYRRPDLGHLEDEVTIDDPDAYTRPFTLYGHFPLQPGTELMEYICNENNQDVQHIVGKDSR